MLFSSLLFFLSSVEDRVMPHIAEMLNDADGSTPHFSSSLVSCGACVPSPKRANSSSWAAGEARGAPDRWGLGSRVGHTSELSHSDEGPGWLWI